MFAFLLIMFTIIAGFVVFELDAIFTTDGAETFGRWFVHLFILGMIGIFSG